jgi:hypothetical protein
MGLFSRLVPHRVRPLDGEVIAVLAVSTEARGNPAIHDATVYPVVTKWAADGSLWQACIVRVAHRAAAKQLDTSVLQWRRNQHRGHTGGDGVG